MSPWKCPLDLLSTGRPLIPVLTNTRPKATSPSSPPFSKSLSNWISRESTVSVPIPSVCRGGSQFLSRLPSLSTRLRPPSCSSRSSDDRQKDIREGAGFAHGGHHVLGVTTGSYWVTFA